MSIKLLRGYLWQTEFAISSDHKALEKHRGDEGT